MANRRKAVWFLCIVLAASTAWLIYAFSSPSAAWTEDQILAFMRGADKVELVFRDEYSTGEAGKEVHHPGETRVLTDKSEIAAFVSAVELQPTEVCGCKHDEEIVFHKGIHTIVVSICDHCFDVEFGETSKHYGMPAELYARFNELAAAYREEAAKETAQKTP